MSYPDIAAASAAAHRADLLRRAEQDRIVTRSGRRARNRLIAWLDGQRLGHRRAPAGRPTPAAATR